MPPSNSIWKNRAISRCRLNAGDTRPLLTPHARRKVLLALAIACLACTGITSSAFPETEAKEDEQTVSPLIGTWTMSMPSAEGIQNPELKVYEKRGKLRGWLKGKRGKMRLKKIAAEGDQFTFVQVIPMGSEELKLTFQGTVRGDHIQGVMTSKKLPKLPFSGVRKPSED